MKMKKINEKQAVRKQALEEGAFDIDKGFINTRTYQHKTDTGLWVSGCYYVDNLNRYSNKKGEIK
jgi:hypothetical protein